LAHVMILPLGNVVLLWNACCSELPSNAMLLAIRSKFG
jgi:hypothetical protein